jgi:hypothetical protein
MRRKKYSKAWVIAVDMGYGHQRAAYPLKEIAYQKIFTANSEKIISQDERKAWLKLRTSYEKVTKYSTHSIIGKILFMLYKPFQEISSLYPFRDLKRPSIGVLYFENLIKKKKLCHSIIEYMKTQKLPVISTFPIPAIAAEIAGMNDIYCIVTDSDIQRAWVPRDTEKTKITYLVPCHKTLRRLREYGIPEEHIIITGFPLPTENVGRKKEILKKDLIRRMSVLDPTRIYYNKYKDTINKYLGIKRLPKINGPIQMTFSIGGAGAQKEVAVDLINALKEKIKKKELIFNVIIGMHLEMHEYFKKIAEKLGMEDQIGKGIRIIAGLNKYEYFEKSAEVLRQTDILWTKPSELSFFCALGIPIIITKPIGTHEEHNKTWLIEIGAGIPAEKTEYVNDWLYDLINQGEIAEAAWNGFMDAPCMGTYNIEKVVLNCLTYKEIAKKKGYIKL